MPGQAAPATRVTGLRYHWLIYVALAFFGGCSTLLEPCPNKKRPMKPHLEAHRRLLCGLELRKCRERSKVLCQV